MKKKDYCTQNNGDCATCSLTNYGLDCQNNPIKTERRKTLRGWEATMYAYNGHHGPVTIQAVLDQIPDELKQRLTGRELGLVMSAINKAYHNGRASCQAAVIDGDAIWIDPLDRLFELADIAKLP